ncbi:Hypothetical predicted protein [Mytilus galloprovincialis]|uniref:Tubulin delta chain n=1 Tax=Mytilus galloprovincialis TaxID=29158 RepID=A0A8B6G4R9_MYTGA|nr:Hypothetical predicted protein [Mytilus galloprovincialis]
MLALYLSISCLDGSIERKILEWELEISSNFDNSFICRINKILLKYQLPKAEEIMEHPPSKYIWKKQLKTSINEYWSSIWTKECNTKSTLKHLSLQKDLINNPHNIMKCDRNNQYDIKKKAELKCYHGLKKSGEDHILEDTSNQVRKEIERCDMYSGCIMMHSLTGGTGSGESPLQNYNALLTLSYLQRNTDCVVLTYNDDVLGKLQRKMESVSFDAMNTSIVSSLGGVFLPTDTMTPKSGPSIGMEPWEMIRSVCPLPANKFVQVHHIAKSKLSWAGLQKQMSQGIRRHDSKGNVFGSIGNVVIARGDSTETFYPQMTQGLEKKFRKSFNTVSWNPFPIDIWTAKTNSIGPKDSSITVASNSESIVEYLETVYERSRVKFAAKAYLHWYNKYGVTNEDFEEAFDVVEDIIQNYKSAFS